MANNYIQVQGGRDPFARTTLVRRVVETHSSCTWCGNKRLRWLPLKPGMIVRTAGGSGIDSDKSATVISWSDPRAQAERTDYPFVGGRTPQSMGWTALLFEDGSVGSMPNNRIIGPSRTLGLFEYGTERDGIGKSYVGPHWHTGLFCSKGCHDSYHS